MVRALRGHLPWLRQYSRTNPMNPEGLEAGEAPHPAGASVARAAPQGGEGTGSERPYGTCGRLQTWRPGGAA